MVEGRGLRVKMPDMKKDILGKKKSFLCTILSGS